MNYSAGLGAAEVITNAIIAKLEAGVRPWRQPWKDAAGRPLRACGTPYRGINTIWLWVVATSNGFSSPIWMTYRQASELGGQVRRGERGTLSVFYKAYQDQRDPDDDDRAGVRRIVKSYTVFNVDQIDNLPTRFTPVSSPPLPPADECDVLLDAFFGRVPAIVVPGPYAAYRPDADVVTMPPLERFEDRDHYWATLAHELAHWTGHASRLDRTLSGRFGSEAYAAEELIAELASAMLGADLGLPVAHLDDHASYIGGWLKVLKADPRAILMASAKAEEAAQYLLTHGASRPEVLDLAA